MRLGRRHFVALLGGAAAWPLVARAQQAGKVSTVGYIGGTTPTNEAPYIAALLQRLRELGWVEGQNLALEPRWADGEGELVGKLAAELVRLKVDVIVTSGNEASLDAKRATSAVPIVFAIAGDPVGTGLVASLARPGGNVTGLSAQLTDGAGKRVELLREAVPGLRRLGLMAHVVSLSTLEVGEVRAVAASLGIEVVLREIRSTGEIASSFDELKGRADALYVANSAFLSVNRMRVTTLALGLRMPTMFANRAWLETGGLMSYGASFPERFRRSADLVDKILRGTRPADIPVEQPTKFELAINLVAAKAIGLTIPAALLTRADEVIE
jgi:putative tryptophan/tyrosine transport system substrate-binding protein